MAFAPPRRTNNTTTSTNGIPTRLTRQRPTSLAVSQLPVRSPTKPTRPVSAAGGDGAVRVTDKENVDSTSDDAPPKNSTDKRGSRVIASRYMQTAAVASRKVDLEARLTSRLVSDATTAKRVAVNPPVRSRTTATQATQTVQRGAAPSTSLRRAATVTASTPGSSSTRSFHAETPSTPARSVRRATNTSPSVPSSPRSSSSRHTHPTTTASRRATASTGLSQRDRLLLTVRAIQHDRAASMGELNLVLLESSAKSSLESRWRHVKGQNQTHILDSSARQLRCDGDQLTALTAKDLLALDTALARVQSLQAQVVALHDRYTSWRGPLHSHFSPKPNNTSSTSNECDGELRLVNLPTAFHASLSDVRQLAQSHQRQLLSVAAGLRERVCKIERDRGAVADGRDRTLRKVSASASPVPPARSTTSLRPGTGGDGGGSVVESTGTVTRLIDELDLALTTIVEEVNALSIAARASWQGALEKLDVEYDRLAIAYNPTTGDDGSRRYAWD